MSESFDVFLSHNSKDKPTVRQLAQALQARGLKVWLDEEQLVPGRPWQQALEEIIQTARTAAVLVGKDGLGPWEIPEMHACLSRFVKGKLPVIPVLLPEAPTEPELPLFLSAFTWVDLRGGWTDDGLDRLEWGITGVKPGKAELPKKPQVNKPGDSFRIIDKTQVIVTKDLLRTINQLENKERTEERQRTAETWESLLRMALQQECHRQLESASPWLKKTQKQFCREISKDIVLKSVFGGKKFTMSLPRLLKMHCFGAFSFMQDSICDHSVSL